MRRPDGGRADGAPSDPPLVFAAKQANALRLAAVDEAALALGLTPGLALADARARVPDLDVVEHDPDADRRALEAIADRCDRFSPTVALDPPDGVTLDIAGCAHLFGGEPGLVAAVRAALNGDGWRARLAAAAGPEAAQALARFGPPGTDEATRLRALPVAALRLAPDIETALRRAGLRSVGDLAARPSLPLAARFGEATVAALDRLLGARDSRLVARRTPAPLVLDRRFAEPVATTPAMLRAAEALVAEAARQLAARHQGGRRFALRLYRSDGQRRDLAVETGRPERDPAVVMRLFAERIDSLSDPIDPGFGFDQLRLAVPVVEPLDPGQLRLDGGATADAEVAALIDRLSVRAGRGRFRRLVPRDTHIPEQAVLALPAAEGAAPPAAWPEPEPGEPPARPVHLFDPPQPIEVVAGVPDGPPQRFRWRRDLHEVVRAEGPERIAAEWWRRPADRPGLTRDYFRVEDSAGRRFWLFRHGLYGAEAETPAWYLHGLFA